MDTQKGRFKFYTQEKEEEIAMVNITNSERNIITVLVQLAVVVGASISVIAYMGSRRHTKLQQEVAELDKEIKLLQLQEKKATVS